MQTLKPPLILSQEKLWVGIGTDKLGQKVSGKSIPFSLKSYVGAEDLLSVQINSQVGLITSKDFAYMIQYDRQQNDGSVIFRSYRYWRYANLAILTHFSLGNNVFVNVGKLTASEIPFFSIVPFHAQDNASTNISVQIQLMIRLM